MKPKKPGMLLLAAITAALTIVCVYVFSRSEKEETVALVTPPSASEGTDSMPQSNGAATHELAQVSSPVQQDQGTSGKPKTKQQTGMTGKGITVIGDSVIIGVEPYLKEQLPEITVDGKVGRQMSQANKIVDRLKSQEKLGDQIVIELGTNGPFNKKQLRSLLDSLSEAEQVLLVTTRLPKNWQDTVNANIKEVAGEYSNTEIVDWYAASEGKKEYFYKDGVHLKPEGCKFYTSLLIDALQK